MHYDDLNISEMSREYFINENMKSDLAKVHAFLGVDVGSVSTNLVLIDSKGELLYKLYLRTMGQPLQAIKDGMIILKNKFGKRLSIKGVGTTGSGRKLAAVMLGADIVKNEITAHAIAAQFLVPDVRTIIEIGGQDSKITILNCEVVSDFAMNTVCAAGTGSFIDRQASRLNIPIEVFGDIALKSKKPVRIAGRCAVFAESDMIHKQQSGHSAEDIIAGLCDALVRNYLSNVAKGKSIEEPILFQGGVAANKGIVAAFESALNKRIIVPEHFDVMGAYGSALLAKANFEKTAKESLFIGFDLVNTDFRTQSFVCEKCSNQCEIVEFIAGSKTLGCWGDRCGRWASKKTNSNIETA